MSTNPGLYIKGVIKVPSEVASHRITLLPSPLALPATQIRYNSFYANWTSVTRATGYCLDIAFDASFTNYLDGYEAYDVGNVNTIQIDDLDPETDYYYRLRAYNDTLISLRSNIIHVKTISQYLQDKDGNNYTSIIVGTKEWIVENLKTTHYADGTTIPNLTENETANLITGWTNSDWSTFSPSGPDISSAIKAAGSYGHATSNIMALTAGDNLHGTINCSLSSGSLGQLVLLKGGANYHYINLVPGVNNFSWSITESNDYQLLLLSNMAGTSMSAEVVANSLKLAGWADDTVGAYCWYDNDIANKTPYGARYNGYAVNNEHGLIYLERGGVEEIGFRMPIREDFEDLSTELGGDTVSGGKLKEVGLTHWESPNTGATNEIGFTAVPSGYRTRTGEFNGLGTCEFIWTSEAYVENEAYYVQLWSVLANFYIYGYADYLNEGMSVRLVRDLS